MQIIDLFSGIGGFSLAGHWLGWETIQFVEINPFGQKVLAYHFPGVPIHDNIKTLDYESIKRRTDPNRPTIVVGGFPCQPYSAAGKRKGKEDDRHLWPWCIKTVRELRPDFCVFENVLGLVNWNGGMVFDEVQSDLEAQGYEVWPYVLPACAKNAPHRRDRVWFVAYANGTESRNNNRANDRQAEKVRRQNKSDVFTEFRSVRIATSTNSKSGEQSIEREREVCRQKRGTLRGITPSTCQARTTPNPESKPSKWMQPKQSKPCEQKQGDFGGNCGEMGNGGIVTNPGNQGLQGSEINGSITGSRAFRNKQPSRLLQPDWQDFPTQSPVCNGDDGISAKLDGITFPKWRNESIKAGGNAIVPQVIFEIFKAIEQYERPNTIRTIRRTEG